MTVVTQSRTRWPPELARRKRLMLISRRNVVAKRVRAPTRLVARNHPNSPTDTAVRPGIWTRRTSLPKSRSRRSR